MEEEQAKCELCGNPMPEGEEMFKYHGHSCTCPPAKKAFKLHFNDEWLKEQILGDVEEPDEFTPGTIDDFLAVAKIISEKGE